MKSCISNPPYNMKWIPPIFAQMQSRFSQTAIPPASNANFAFILTGLNECDKSCFILPNIILTAVEKEELEIKKYLVEKNYLESVIICPEKMFESTSIPVCLITFNKNKKTSKIEMIDMRNTCIKEIREQKGQFGSSSHTNRTYKKEINIFTDEQIEKAIDSIANLKDEKDFSKAVTIEEIKQNDYNLYPTRYIEEQEQEDITRSYEDIVKDLNKVISEKNVLKITINETIAKSLGLYDVFLKFKESKQFNSEINDSLKKIVGSEIIKEDFIALSKNKNEIKFENNSKDKISDILMLIFQTWKQHIYYLNTEENRYLAELKDKLLPDLMSGKIEL